MNREDLKKFTLDHEVIIVNYEMLKRKEMLEIFKYAEMVIVDECHYLKNFHSQRTLYFHHLLERFKPARALFLSGTPIDNRVTEFFPLLYFCSLNPYGTSGIDIRKVFKSEYDFNDTFCYSRKVRYNGVPKIKWTGLRKGSLSRLKKLLKNKYIRRTADEVLDLPPITSKEILFKTKISNKKLLEEWDKLEGTGKFTPVEGKKKHKDTATNSSSLRAKAALLKAPHTVDYVKMLKEEIDTPIVIFTDHIASAEHIAKSLPKSALITGKVAIKDRQPIVDALQDGKYDYLVVTIGAGREGFTMTRCRNLVFNDLSWVPGRNSQAKKRIHRIGQKGSCVVHYILGGAADELITKLLIEKVRVLKKVL